jgi:chromosome segregation ATPase
LLPKVDAQFKDLDTQVRLRVEQRDHLRKRLQDILTAPDPKLLATADERIAGERIHRLEVALAKSTGADAAALRERVQRLKGVLTWDLYTQFPERLTEAYAHLAELNENVKVMRERYDSFVRARQAAVHSYEGYDPSISRLRTRVRDGLERVNTLLAQQGQLIETVAISELKTRSERLEAYQTQARYAVADSYDRATKTQGGGGQP